MAQIIVNDEKQDVTLPLTLSELIKLNKVFQPEMVTVQVNEEFVERDVWDTTSLKDRRPCRLPVFHGRRCRMIDLTEEQMRATAAISSCRT